MRGGPAGRYGLSTTLRELAADHAALDVVVQHAAAVFGALGDPTALADLTLAEIVDRTSVLTTDEIERLDAALAQI
jgi:hypothetical protein